MKKLLLLFVLQLLPLLAGADAIEINGIYYNLVSKVKTAEVTKKPSGYYSGVVNIPKTVTYGGITYDVIMIGDNAFFNCLSLTSVTIPNSVTSIGSHAFAGCESLTSVTIPNSVTSIGSNAFQSCTGLTSFTIPNSVTSIGSQVFLNCSGLTSVTIPNSVTEIGMSVFWGCSGLNSVTIPNSVTKIGFGAFRYCSGLTSVTILNNVTSIGESAFRDCSGLTSVTIPNSVTSIGVSAFRDCSSLTSITIGSGVKKIYSFAFASCKELTDVYCLADEVPAMYDYNYNTGCTDAFQDSYIEYATLHVPASTLNDYKTTEPWSSFRSIVSLPGTSSYTLTYMIDGEIYKTYKLSAGSTITPEPEPKKEGYTFSGWSTIPKTMPEHDVTVYGSFVKNTNYMPGDVNNDGSVSVTDVGCAINYILEQVPSVFVFDAADMNGDKSVSVTDVGMIINLVLSEGVGSRKYGKTMETNDHDFHSIILPNVSLASTADSNLELMLEDKDAFIGFQFDVDNAEGAGWHGACPYISMQLSDGDDHVLTSRQLSNGKWRVVCYSPSNSTFSPNSGGSLVSINTEHNISLSNILLTTAGFDELRLATIVSTPTDIASVEQGVKINAEGGILRIISDRNITLRLYSLGGSAYRILQVKKGMNSFEGLRAGIYMINNKKVILR